MGKKETIMVVIALVCLGGAALIAKSYMGGPSGKDGDFGAGYLFLCTECGATRLVSEDEYLDLYTAAREAGNYDEEVVACPDCGSHKMVRAQQCPECHEIFSAEEMRAGCPKCMGRQAP